MRRTLSLIIAALGKTLALPGILIWEAGAYLCTGYPCKVVITYKAPPKTELIRGEGFIMLRARSAY